MAVFEARVSVSGRAERCDVLRADARARSAIKPGRQLEDGSGRVAMVHFTWSMNPERAPFWPETVIFDSLNRWAETVLAEVYQDPA